MSVHEDPALLPPPSVEPVPPDVPVRAADEPEGFFDRPSVIRKLKLGSILILLGFFVADFFVHFHEVLGGENVPGFYLVGGFLASVALIAIAKIGGKPLKRGTDYYD